ncbi:metal ABC transporter substrate-binding protein [Plastoroseomonas hellenica]|uniref:metal ABC transporter substrate-binding protein n=1 Tax=Plastoroseomonas hellenica TaxID=2687306 RepID=UPI001BADAF7E|nr:metal ABC transporter substrate-binding protein [Plastoroseomonas hellenica]MBR0646283.1 metal ABC transporter substrate-binding protein [Plastoroseomonas hellenica]
MPFSRSRRLLGLVALAGLMACGLTGTGQAQPARPKRIVTTFTIIQDMAQTVAGEAAIVESITRPGAEIHDYEPTPLDVVRAQAADLVLWNGMGLERWFERFFQRVRDVPSAVLTEGVTPINITEGPYAGRPNPHAWMSPANAVIYVENIRRALVALDPDNAEVYNRNAAAYTERLRGLDAPIRARLERIPADRRWLVSCEGAFSYLTQNYGMQELSLWPVNADDEGTPRQVRRVVDTVRRSRIPVLFCESTVSDRAMRQVARETGARFAGVLYVDSLTAPDGEAPTYVQLLEFNANAIVRAFDQALPASGRTR